MRLLVVEDDDAIAAALDDVAARTGVDVPIHVDGASGAMIAPSDMRKGPAIARQFFDFGLHDNFYVGQRHNAVGQIAGHGFCEAIAAH